MKLLDRYKKVISFKVDKPKETVYVEIIKVSKGRRIDDHNIQVIFKPAFFDPFAGRGLINLRLTEDDNKTEVRCEIVPTSITKSGLYILALLLSAWTVLGLLISYNFYSLLTNVFGWIMMLIIIHFSQTLNRGKLESYIRYTLSSIKKVKQKSVV